MTYAEEMTALAHTLSELLARDPRKDTAPLTHAFAGRDAVVSRLTAMLGSIAGPYHGYQEFPARHIANDPAHALQSALRELPRLSGPDRISLVDMHQGEGSPDLALWQRARRQALQLEPYTDALQDLPGPAAWRSVRDIAEMALAIPVLDRGLIARNRSPLVDAGAHGAIYFAAEELRAHAPEGIPHDLTVERARWHGPVRTLTDVPAATRGLATLLSGRAGDISATEIRATARMLSDGLDITARALGIVDNVGRESALLHKALDRTAAASTKLYSAPLATLGPPTAPAQLLATDIATQLRSLSGLLDQVTRMSDRDQRAPASRRVMEAALSWTAEVPPVVTALTAAVRAGHTSGKLLGPPVRERDDDLPLRWVSTRFDVSAAEPTVLAVEREARFGAANLRKALLHYLPPPTSAHELADAIGVLSRTADVSHPPRRRLPPHPHTRTGLRHRNDIHKKHHVRGRETGDPTTPPAI